MTYCDECNNTGIVDCRCGGDTCVCNNYGEIPCPKCDGRMECDGDGQDYGFYDYGY